LAEYSLQLAAK